jgi:hypothetical protein
MYRIFSTITMVDVPRSKAEKLFVWIGEVMPDGIVHVFAPGFVS